MRLRLSPLTAPSRGALLCFCAAMALSCASEEYARLYRASPRAPSLGETAISRLEHLGPSLVDRGVNFGVYSEKATRVELLLFDAPDSSRPTRQFELTRFGDVWNVYVEGLGLGQHYGYVAWGPNWGYDPNWFCGSVAGFVSDVDGEGNRFNPNKLLLDPYAKALSGEHDWSKGSIATGPKRAECTWAAAVKGVIVQSSYTWTDEETQYRLMRKNPNAPGHRWNDLIIYEVHAKGLTKSAASGVAHPGTYRGIAEKADYLKDLGINALELLPIHEKPLDGGYWGYQTLSFFAPERDYASRRNGVEIIDEFKFMVEELHKRGIEVIVDVVFNHTGEGGLWREKLAIDGPSLTPGLDLQVSDLDPKEVAGLYSFRGLDNQAYYALSADKQTYWNNTGVGNQLRANHRPTRRLIMDSLRFYVEELHVDGFRFDLAPILGDKDGDYNTFDDPVRTVLQEIIDDPLLRENNVRVIAEPWSLNAFRLGDFPASKVQPGNGWYEWNGHFRDWWRAFMNDDNWKLNSREGDSDGGGTLTGSASLFQAEGRKPHHSVNFVTVHDGFTMFDLFSYGAKQNRCGPLNPICCPDVPSAFCDGTSGESNNRSRSWTATGAACSAQNPGCPYGQGCEKGICSGEPFKRQLMRNLYLALFISHGTPMIFGGDEWLRTQLGNNNAYSNGADNAFNWFDWGVWLAQAERHRMYDFVKQAIRLRKKYAHAFSPDGYGTGAPFAWKTRFNADAQPADFGGKAIAQHYYDASKGAELLVLINMETSPLDFTLPAGRSWHRLVDTQQYFDLPHGLAAEGAADLKQTRNVTLDAPARVAGATYGVPSRSIVVLEAR